MTGRLPSRLNHRQWWSIQKEMPQPKGVAPLGAIKDVLPQELTLYFAVERKAAIFSMRLGSRVVRSYGCSLSAAQFDGA